MGAIQFIENLDRTSLTVSDATFERNVEASVSAIVERHGDEFPPIKLHQVSEKSRISEPAAIPQNSMSVDYTNSRRITSPGKRSTDRFFKNDGWDENRAVNSLLRTIQGPLTSIGRIFSEESSSHPAPILPPRLSPAVFQPPRNSGDERRSLEESRGKINPDRSRLDLAAEDAAVQQASADSAEAQRIQINEHNDIVEWVPFKLM